MGIRFDNFTGFGEDPRTISIVIEKSNDPTRIGKHDIEHLEHFSAEPNERGRILNWIPGRTVPFVHEQESAWVRSIDDEHLSIRNLRAFTRPEIQQIKRKRGSILGLHVSFTPITKERFE
jgi:hypothetical protein